MINNLGPKAQAQLDTLLAGVTAAKKHVQTLEALRVQRLAEQATAQPVTAQADPVAVAHGAALATATAQIVAAIDRELVTARAALQAASYPYHQMQEGFIGASRRVVELSAQIDRLTIERDGLQASLDA